MARPSTGTPLSAPLLPNHPQLLHQEKHGENTVWVSPDLPSGMARPNGQWSLSDFQLTKQLYKGKASTLYQAVDKPSGTTVALKSYSKRRLSPLNWYQVEREVRLHAQLRHPSIIALHAAFQDDNYVFMVTEYAEGGDLYEDLKRAGGQMRERAVAGEVLPPFMAALAFMHANSIVHRDIKPENILLTADRAIKVADFGLSINWAEERPVTRAGTLDYMSPEVLQCPEKSKPEENKERVELGYTDAVDVWAVGVLAYELLVGRPPFERESREETYHYIQHKEPVLPAWMGEPARDFVTAALAKSARKRPTMAQLLQHPWIQLHARRPSIPASPPAASDLHIPLHQLAGPGGKPFSELHRHSLHGAKSVRDFSSLLSPAPSGSPHLLTALLQPALSMASQPMAAAAAAALGGPPSASRSGSTSGSSSTLRPTTASSRLGPGAGQRPGTPLAGPVLQALSAGLPAPAFPEASSSGVVQYSAASDQQVVSAPSTEHAPASSSLALPSSSHGRASKLLNSPFNVQQAVLAPAAPAAGEPQSAFLELYKSLVPALPEGPGGAAPTPRGTSRKGTTTLSHAGSKGSSQGRGLEAALPPLQAQQYQDSAQPAPPTAPGRLPSLRKAPSQPVLMHGDEASPAAVPAAAPPTTAADKTAALDGPVVSRPTLEAANLRREPDQPALALAAIPEQRSSESEPDAASMPASKPDGGHLVRPAPAARAAAQAAVLAAKEQPAAAEEPGRGRIAAVRAPAQPPSAAKQQDRSQQQEQVPAQAEASEPGQGSFPMLAAEASAIDRMREAEQRHVEKLRGRAASIAVPASHPAGASHSSAAAPGGEGSLKQRQQRTAVASSGYGSGLAKSASHLLSKLLGKKEKVGSLGRSVSAGPSSASSASPAASRSSIARKASTAAVERSAASISASAASSSSIGGSELAAGTPTHSKSPQKPRLSAPALHISARAGSSFLHTSPRSQPSLLHASDSMLVQRRSVAAVKPGSSTITLRSPVGARTSKVAPAANGAVPPQVTAQHASPAAAVSDPAVLPPAAAPAPSTDAGRRGSNGGKQEVQPSSNSKTVRFAGPLAPAGPSRDLQDLIPAVHHTESASYTTAYSSLPSSSLPSLTASGAASPLRASSKGSMSPPVSCKASHLMPTPTRTSLLRAAGAGTLAGGQGSPSRMRSGKMASMPGDGGKGAAAGDKEAGQGGAEEGEAVHRSAASWSHTSRSPYGPSSKAKLSPAAKSRLHMYMELNRH
ncbi:hypothetical protein ABPG75_007646 [Micractinium tetrahymenae]